MTEQGADILSPIPRGASFSRQAYTLVRRAIRDGVIVANQTYSELQIARMLGVSRTPVREALIELAREGAVDKMPQRGFMVRSISRREKDEVFHLRAVIEGHVVSELSRLATDADIKQLRLILDRQASAADGAVFLDIDEEFHLAMAELAGLERSKQILLGLRSIIWLSGAAALATSNARSSNVIAEHRAVLDCIAKRDATGARQAIRHHIAQTAEAVTNDGPVRRR